MKIRVDDIILAALTHQNYQPCKVKQLLPQQKYLVISLQQNTQAIVAAQSIRPYTRQNIYKGSLKQLDIEQNECQIKNDPLASQLTNKLKSDKNNIFDPKIQKVSKIERLKLKKRQKEEEEMREGPISSLKSRVGANKRQNSCSTLRLLLQKLGNEASRSFKSSEEQISSYEVQRLKTLLDLDHQLNIYDIVKEWIVQAFILLIKEIKLWGIPRFPDLEHITQDKYCQIRSYILSEQFQELDLPESKKKILTHKVKENQLKIGM